MLWRHLCRVRAWSAAGVLTCSLLGPAAPAWAEPAEPAPDATAMETRTVSILEAKTSGALAVEVRGAGQGRVKLTLKNGTSKRLKVVLPPGLVASSAAAQGARGGGGAGGGGGFQSMGLASVANRPGSFGEFRTPAPDADRDAPAGFRSVGVRGGDLDRAVALPAGQTAELSVVAVCLNFGAPTPTPRDKFELVDVDDYTTDPRARKALRSLATYGTSQGVAQAVMWRVCNDVPFGLMAEQASKAINPHEVAIASRFVQALDASGSTGLVDPAYLSEGRLFVRVAADRSRARDAERLAREIEGLRILGLPARVLAGQAADDQESAAPAMLLNVVLGDGPDGQTKGRVVLSGPDAEGRWAPLGRTTLSDGSALAVLDGAGLARALDRAVASAFVSVKTARRSAGATTFRVENRLPLTLANVTLKAGHSAGAPPVAFPGLGIAPGRAALVTVAAPTAAIDHVELNGL